MKTGKQLGNESAQPLLELEPRTEDCMFLSWTTSGLSKREYFAGLAMQGILANPDFSSVNFPLVAKWAVDCTDILLDELAKTDDERVQKEKE
jgi:hypothetical protein